MVIAFELEITFSAGQVSIFTPPVLTKERLGFSHLAPASSSFSSFFLSTTGLKGEIPHPSDLRLVSREKRERRWGTKRERERERLARQISPISVKGSCVVRGATREYFAQAVE